MSNRFRLISRSLLPTVYHSATWRPLGEALAHFRVPAANPKDRNRDALTAWANDLLDARPPHLAALLPLLLSATLDLLPGHFLPAERLIMMIGAASGSRNSPFWKLLISLSAEERGILAEWLCLLTLENCYVPDDLAEALLSLVAVTAEMQGLPSPTGGS